MHEHLRSGSLWLAALLVALVCPLPAEAITLDWNNVTWTAGSLSQSFETDASNPGNDITITITGNTGSFNTGFPADNTNLTGGQGSTRESLQLYMNQFQNASKFVTVTITFNYAAGVNGVNFLIFDIDRNSAGDWVDQIRNIKGSFGSTNYAATITGSANNSVTGTGLSQLITGTADTDESSGAANAKLDFGTNYVTSVSFDYGNAPGTTVNSIQWASLYDIDYKPKVPEVNPAWGALLVCGLAIGARAWRRTKTA